MLKEGIEYTSIYYSELCLEKGAYQRLKSDVVWEGLIDLQYSEHWNTYIVLKLFSGSILF